MCTRGDNRHLSGVSEKMRPGRTTRVVLWENQEKKTVFFVSSPGKNLFNLMSGQNGEYVPYLFIVNYN